MKRIFSRFNFTKFRKFRKYTIPLFMGALIVLMPIIYLGFIRPRIAKADWFNSSWNLRKTVTITNNGDALLSHTIQVIIDTQTLISEGKMQADCDDARFASKEGTEYTYFLEIGCNTTKTIFWTQVDTIQNGTTEIYFYYGNPDASTESTFLDPEGLLSIGNGIDGSITVSSNTNINTTNLISGRSCSDGGDAVNYRVTANTSSGQNQVTLATTPSSGCLSVGDEILVINLQGTSGDNSNVGKYETARITNISTATLTLNHNLINAYNGTTQKIMVQRVPNYTNVTVNGSQTLNVSAFEGNKNGVLFFRSDGTTTVTGNININALGYRGGNGGTSGANGGINGESYDGIVGQGATGTSTGASSGGGSSGNNATANPANGSIRGGGGGGGSSGTTDNSNGGGAGGGGGYGFGGGGGGSNSDGSNTTAGTGGTAASGSVNGGGGGGGRNGNNAGANGGNSGSAGSNASGTGGSVGSGTTSASGGGGANNAGGSGAGGGGGGNYGNATLTRIYPGSGGGGGGGGVSGVAGANGANGGGIIYIGANEITISGTISANGGDGNSASARAGAGGAGAGGSIYINAIDATLGSSKVTATGGTRATNASQMPGSGAGGDGRIQITYFTTSGTTAPTLNSTPRPTVTNINNEETQPNGADQLLAYWKMDEGTGNNLNDSSGNSNTGTRAGSTLPSWQSDNQCVKGMCLYFDGSNSSVTVANTISDIKTVSFWVKPNSISSAALVDLNGTARITVSSGTISATGFSSPSIYVNGVESTTLVANEWQYVTVKTSTGINGSAIKLGNYSSTFLQGFMDDVRFYNYQRSEDAKIRFSTRPRWRCRLSNGFQQL